MINMSLPRQTKYLFHIYAAIDETINEDKYSRNENMPWIKVQIDTAQSHRQNNLCALSVIFLGKQHNNEIWTEEQLYESEMYDWHLIPPCVVLELIVDLEGEDER